ncbi:MAG: 4-(cytidine 5'-diphospho)-2-C-methyl-D-erythritol kinase [Atopobiaceae bacterium]|jgi:4-diphosphocytidyl-2-C-methyl-D-erythritol kinase|nr:4-(cytidine 5'-diphospho)-2-C-methyl-D-erythritol kinase [Atopobiaceae bacterium]MCH4180671.1 4-(cytidine 5'-diphospho)-2-C-methyl-D-erythritol kinase [Atopobiaceae bacterium]MCH4214688.1 4-(cytidine 5'-diphospho)-2-C-methyl-D-erythritol kinase [Atopobiaceae bacterium]MCH4229906.1 4-(cytidine 5'-diphospho)-2-C-methyl-D-erythritol kinase [Atopobiaceae bacterium]MCH4276734.1 4-(cytidine 5'-diphospho)-2-C-methyl-D-erythritol kinase [Atopobiaceae bacterium]
MASRASYTFEAPAKVNLYLGVRPQRDARGYHRVDSVMCAVDVYDDVTVTQLMPGMSTEVVCDPDAGCPVQGNTCYKAVQALAGSTGHDPCVRVDVRKRIPARSGTGGASSDAAAVLLALDRLWDLGGRTELLAEAARTVGADVPFFLYGPAAWLSGAGDVLERTYPEASEVLGSLHLALVRAPGEGVSTPAAYAAFDKDPPAAAPIGPMLAALVAGDADGVVAAIANNLEPAACLLDPVTREVRDWLARQVGTRAAHVTGSGSTCFAVCEGADVAARVVAAAQGRGWWARSASPIDHGPREMA